MRLSLFVPPLAPVILNAVKDTLPPFVLPVYPEERRAPTSSSAFHRLTRRNITATERSHSTSKLSEGEPKRLAIAVPELLTDQSPLQRAQDQSG